MTELPDLTGYLYNDAVKILNEFGAEYSISRTSSPRNDVDGEEERVVRQIIKDNTVYITLCTY